jgi:hypothetical protein
LPDKGEFRQNKHTDSRVFPFLLTHMTVKFGTGGLHIMPIGAYEFRENRRSEGRTFVMGPTQITFTLVPSHRKAF